MSDLARIHGKHPVFTNGGNTWYQMACKFLKLKHHLHSLFCQRREQPDLEENPTHKEQN
ncbi:MAG TPA: hypothetical protein VFG45_13185 [Candidatus Nitrosocosmicus sp.]|nr:hypothetical protein [Candidatus Nitrosocosmicus sp.]